MLTRVCHFEGFSLRFDLECDFPWPTTLFGPFMPKLPRNYVYVVRSSEMKLLEMTLSGVAVSNGNEPLRFVCNTGLKAIRDKNTMLTD